MLSTKFEMVVVILSLTLQKPIDQPGTIRKHVLFDKVFYC